MRKILIVFLALCQFSFGQSTFQIHHLFGINDGTPGLHTLSALEQASGSAVEVETFSLNFEAGDPYTYSLSSNALYFLDNNAITNPSILHYYYLPELYQSGYVGFVNSITFQGRFEALCMQPIGDSSLYVYDVNTRFVNEFSLLSGSLSNSSQTPLNLSDTSELNIVYYNDKLFVSGRNPSGFFTIYAINALNLQTLDSAILDFNSFHLEAHPSVGLVAIGSSLQDQYFFAEMSETLGLGTSFPLPSCTNCASEFYSYPSTASVIDADNQHLIVSRSVEANGQVLNFLSTYDLASGQEIYNVQTPVLWNNLIYQKPQDDLVYPGDANHDKIVNILDVLPIGLNYAQPVEFRNQISIDWIGQQGLNTGDTLANGVDVKHADCNGDGQINSIDVDAIIQNYSFKHYSEKSTHADCDFPLYIVKPSFIKEDEAISIQIGLDLSANPLQDVYGVTFTLEYDTQFVVPNSLSTQGVNAWFGTENANYLKVDINDFPAGKMDVAVVGIDQVNRNGGGILLDGIWTMEDVVIPIAQGFDTMNLVISNVAIIDYYENIIDACGGLFSLQVYDKNVGIVERTYGNLEMYPNPSQQSNILLKNIDDIEKVEAYDLQGKLLQVWEGSVSSISLEGFSTGVYFIKAYSKEVILTNKLIYNKI